jgi:hypothetical protein
MSLDDALKWLFQASPWWLAAVAILVTVALSIAFNLPAWAGPIIGAIRLAALGRMTSVKLERQPDNPVVSDGGTADDVEVQNAATSNITTRTPDEAASEPSGG